MFDRWKRKSAPDNVVAVLDDDEDFLSEVRMRFQESSDVEVYTYRYEDQYQDFLDNVGQFTHIMIDHRLGGENGANVMRNLIAWGVRAKMAIVSVSDLHDYSRLGIYFTKDQFAADPRCILGVHMHPSDLAADTVYLADRTPPETHHARH